MVPSGNTKKLNESLFNWKRNKAVYNKNIKLTNSDTVFYTNFKIKFLENEHVNVSFMVLHNHELHVTNVIKVAKGDANL